MKIAQELVEIIISNIESKVKQGFKGNGIGIHDTQKRVVSISATNSGERRIIGIDDTKGSYFYFRLREKTQDSKVTGSSKMSSCDEWRQLLPLRLVVQHRCENVLSLLSAFKSALYHQDIQNTTPYDRDWETT